MCAPAVHTTLECTCTGTRATGTKKFIDRATQPGEITELSGRPETGEGRGCGTTYGNWFAKFPPLPFTPSVEGVVRRPFCDCFIYIWRKIRSNVMYCLEKNVSCYKSLNVNCLRFNETRDRFSLVLLEKETWNWWIEGKKGTICWPAGSSKCCTAGNEERRRSQKPLRVRRRRFAFRRCENIPIEEWIPAGCPHHWQSRGTGEKREGSRWGPGACCATAGISWAPLRVAPGPCSAPKASCFSEYDEDIYIPLSFRPRVRGNPRFSPLSVEHSGWGRAGDVRLPCCWEAVNERHGVQDLDIRGCGPGAWVIVVESVTCWSGCIRCEPRWSDVVKLKLSEEIVLFSLVVIKSFLPDPYFFIS